MSSRSNYTMFDASFSDGRTVTPMVPTSFPAPRDSIYDSPGWVGSEPVQPEPVYTIGETSSRASTTALFLLPILISVIVLVLVVVAVVLICTRCFGSVRRNNSVTPRHQSKHQAATMEEHTKTIHNLEVANGNEGAAEYPVAYASTFADGGASFGGDIGGATSSGCSSGDAGGGAACGI